MFALKVVLAVVVGMPIAAAGAALTCTIIGAPIGIPLMFLSGVPLGMVLKRHEERKCLQKRQGRVMENENEVPWLLDETTQDDSV